MRSRRTKNDENKIEHWSRGMANMGGRMAKYPCPWHWARGMAYMGRGINCMYEELFTSEPTNFPGLGTRSKIAIPGGITAGGTSEGSSNDRPHWTSHLLTCTIAFSKITSSAMRKGPMN